MSASEKGYDYSEGTTAVAKYIKAMEESLRQKDWFWASQYAKTVINEVIDIYAFAQMKERTKRGER